VSIHYYLLKKYVESTKKINERIVSFENLRAEATEKPQKIVITSETGKEKIEINLKDLLFIKSTDNYVEVYRAGRDNIEIILLRSSLKQIEENLKSYPFLFRCHRTYLINVNNISKVTGNSQGYKLIFKGVEYPIPVSRSYSKILLQLIV
jgi:DNA-binding LytR/AlgR family response regulator